MNGVDDFLPYMKLSVAGFRAIDWESILTQLGWDQNLQNYLDLKLIEKGIFSRKDAEDKGILRATSHEARVQALMELLCDASTASTSTRWSSIKETAKKVDREVAYLFAIGFQGLSLLTIFQRTLGQWILYGLMDGIYCALKGSFIKVSAADFARSNFPNRMLWLFRASLPERVLLSALFYALKTGGIRAIPQTLYNVYIA